MSYLELFIVSLIQSITEYIPVSSSLHLILMNRYLHLNVDMFKIISIVIQFASSIATLLFYRQKIFSTIFYFFNKKENRVFAYNICISYLPIVLFGLCFYKYIMSYNNFFIISLSLVTVGIFLILIEKKKKYRFKSVDDINYITALKIGVCQIFSLFPGVSRSGSTIVSGMFFGLTKSTAIRYSFLLSIPTTISATLYSGYKNYNLLQNTSFQLISISFILTLILSYFFIKIFINYMNKHSLKIFGIYRILLGIIIILLFHK